MKALLQRLAALDPKVLLILFAAVAFLAVFESWVVLRGPWAELQRLGPMRSRLELAQLRDTNNAAELERLERELAALDRGAGSLPHSDEAMVPFLVATLDGVARRHGVALGGVKPPQQRALGVVEETGFQVEARGDYRSLFAWLDDGLKEVAPLIATDIAFRLAEDGQRVLVSVRLAAYRVAPVAAGASGATR